MTEIKFYTAVRNPLQATLGLIGKIHDKGRRVRVLTPDAAATDWLDSALWQPDTSFTPHVRLDSPLRDVTPIIIDHRPSHDGVADILINLGGEPTPPPFFARFEQLIEIIGEDETLAAHGRARWRFYKARGYEMSHTVLHAAR